MRFLLAAEAHGEEHHDDHAPAANATRAAAAPVTAAAPLHIEEDDGHGHGHGHGHGAKGGDSNANLNLRVVALFVILVGSLLGALPPLLSARLRAPNTFLSSALRAFAGGVILSLALIHIAVHSVLELNEVEAYPYAGVLMLAGVSFMVFSEHCLRMYYHPDPESPVDARAHAVKTIDTHPTHDHEHGNDHHPHSLDLSHCHPTGNSVSRVAAWMMELGCVFHSVIIGVDLGITTDYNALTTLLIALVFHQFIEGISLGTVVAAAGFQRLKAYSMVLLYSITTPVGIAIGIAIASSYDPESRRAVLTKGCLDAVSGGLLLYIAIVHLVCPEFCSSRKAPLRNRLVSYAAFALGASFMAVLAKWA